MAMNIIEKLANTIGRTKGQYLKGLDTVFSTTGSHPTANDDSAFIDFRVMGSLTCYRAKSPKTKKEFIRAFSRIRLYMRKAN